MTGAEPTAAPPPAEDELLVATRPPVAVIEAALGEEFAVRPGETTTVERVLLDTFDGRLRARGWALRWEDGSLTLIDEADGRGELAPAGKVPLPTAPLPPDALPEGELRRAIGDAVGDRALIPLAHLRLTTQTLAILDGLDKTVARLQIDSPVLLVPRGRPIELDTRLRAGALRGYGDDRRRAVALVAQALDLTPAERPLHDEALLRAGASPHGVSSKVRVGLDRRERSDVAAVRVLRRLLEVYDANLPGALADIDPEFLHDLRVSIRRTRAIQRQLRSVFPPGELRRMRDGFRWLQRATGEARDLDVTVLGFDELRRRAPDRMQGDLDPLLVVLSRRRLVAHGQMERALRSDRAAALRRDWEALLDELIDLPAEDRPGAATGIAALSGRRILHVYTRMLKAGDDLGPDSPPEAYHDLRRRAKDLRYLLQLFARPLHDPTAVKPMLGTLRRLQDVLGRHQDRVVQVALLREVADEVGALPGGSAALLAMGALLERLESDAAEIRRAFEGCIDEFADKAQRRRAQAAFS